MASTMKATPTVVNWHHSYTSVKRLIIVMGIISSLGIVALGINMLIPIFKSYEMEIRTLTISCLFIGITLGFALKLANHTARREEKIPQRGKKPEIIGSSANMKFKVDTNSILVSEFEYARESATQAMEERRTVMNIYLLVAGGAGTGAIAFISNSNTSSNKPELQIAAAILLWLVYLIGWLAHFQIIALRRAWRGSAIAMNYIKEFYLDYTKDMDLPEDYLASAFYWKADSIPPAETHWNVGHLSNLSIALLDSAALVAGAILIDNYWNGTAIIIISVVGFFLAIAIFMAHFWTYDIALIPR